MARPPSALRASILGHRGINGALVPELIDAQVHATCLFVVGVRHDFLRLRCTQHATLDGLFDEGLLAARDGDPATMQGIGLGHVARLWQSCWPGERTTWQLEGFVAILKALAHGNLLLGERWAGVRPIVVSQGVVDFGLGQEILCDAGDLVSIWVLTERSTEPAILVLAAKFVRLEQVMEASCIGFPVFAHHGFVQAFFVELWLVQPVLEMFFAHGLNMCRVEGTAFLVVMGLKTIVANIGKCSMH